MRLRRIIAAMLTTLGAAAPAAGTTAPSVWMAEAEAGRAACRKDFLDFATGDDFLTDGLVVQRDGAMVFEYYDGTFGPDHAHALWSASKTVAVTLLGAAIEAGLTDSGGRTLSLDLALAEALDVARDPDLAASDAAPSADLKLRHLVEMTSGLAWSESYEEHVSESNVLGMLYLEGSADMARYALDMPMVDAPGARWNYSGGNVNLLMAALRRFAGTGYADLPWRLLFDPLGMGRETGVVIERDAAGTFVGSSYVYMTPRDMARLGQLYLQNGIWEGRRILPEDWTTAARTPDAAQGRLELGPEYIAYVDREGLYGQRSFWLNADVPGLAKQFPSAPADLFFAAGHYGQLILVLPSQQLVIARTGHDAEYWSRIDAFVTKAMACFAA